MTLVRYLAVSTVFFNRHFAQRRAVERVSAVLFSDVLNSASEQKSGQTCRLVKEIVLRGILGEPGRTRTSNPLIKSQLLYH